jgi:hypothetical protein
MIGGVLEKQQELRDGRCEAGALCYGLGCYAIVTFRAAYRQRPRQRDADHPRRGGRERYAGLDGRRRECHLQSSRGGRLRQISYRDRPRPLSIRAMECGNEGAANDPRSYDPTSPAYKQAAALAQGVFRGVIQDQTGGATHYYAPAAQALNNGLVGQERIADSRTGRHLAPMRMSWVRRLITPGMPAFLETTAQGRLDCNSTASKSRSFPSGSPLH